MNSILYTFSTLKIQKEFDGLIEKSQVLQAEKIANNILNLSSNVPDLDCQSILNKIYVDKHLVIPLHGSCDCLVLCKENQINDNDFYLCDCHKICTVNFKSRIGSDIRDAGDYPKPSENIQELIEKLNDYLKELYDGEKGCYIQEKDGIITIIYSVCLCQRDSNGMWSATYKIENNKISGDIIVSIHQSDESSVDVEKKQHINESDISSDNTEIVDFIKKNDNKILV